MQKFEKITQSETKQQKENADRRQCVQDRTVQTGDIVQIRQ